MRYSLTNLLLASWLVLSACQGGCQSESVVSEKSADKQPLPVRSEKLELQMRVHQPWGVLWNINIRETGVWITWNQGGRNEADFYVRRPDLSRIKSVDDFDDKVHFESGAVLEYRTDSIAGDRSYGRSLDGRLTIGESRYLVGCSYHHERDFLLAGEPPPATSPVDEFFCFPTIESMQITGQTQ